MEDGEPFPWLICQPLRQFCWESTAMECCDQRDASQLAKLGHRLHFGEAKVLAGVATARLGDKSRHTRDSRASINFLFPAGRPWTPDFRDSAAGIESGLRLID